MPIFKRAGAQSEDSLRNLYPLVRPWLYRLDAEQIHDRTLALLRAISNSAPATSLLAKSHEIQDQRLVTPLFNREFASPLAIAAGLDKQGIAVPALNALGFGFVEVGTVTRHPQPGNEKPRVFRLPEDHGLINRMGFPSPGCEVVYANLSRISARGTFAINVGPNKDRVGHAAEDALAVISRLAPLGPVAIVINVSSPNTARLRSLQGKAALSELLGQIVQGLPIFTRKIPLLVKIAPDLDDREIDDVLTVVTDLGVGRIVATNTILARPSTLKDLSKSEGGGLSGEPLAHRSSEVVARISFLTNGKFQIVAAGGVFSGADVLDKIGAGATVVQTYTGLIYEGPGMAKRAGKQMLQILERQGIRSLDEIRGSGYRAPRN